MEHGSSNWDLISHDGRAVGSAPDQPAVSRAGSSPAPGLAQRPWKYIVRKTVREFGKDECIDAAAALTFYAVLAIFPATLAMISLVSLIGHGRSTTAALIGVVEDLGPAAVADTLREPVLELGRSPSVGWALALGLGGAIWSASGYIGAFGRAMNHVYEVPEGRPFWKLRPTMLLITLAAVVLMGLVGVGLVVSGPVARDLGAAIGLQDTTVTIWNIAKWPVLLAMIILVVALLYYATPNVRHPRFRWMSPGSVIAIVTWVLASFGLSFYVGRIAKYGDTYGSLAGVVVFLLWIYVSNLALLFGAEVDAEVERGRELQAGIEAEDSLQLLPRDTRATEKKAAKLAKDIELGRALREQHLGGGQGSDAEPPGIPSTPVPVSTMVNRRAWGAGPGSGADLARSPGGDNASSKLGSS